MKIVQVLLWICFFIFSSCRNKPYRFYASDKLKVGAEGDTAWSIGMIKYGVNFNKYRKANDLPLLPENFYLFKSGLDYAEWKNPLVKYPNYNSKIIVWYGWGTKEPFLIWENNLYSGKNGEVLSFRFGRKESDSLVMNFDSIEPSYLRETDSLYWKSYRYFDASGARTILTKQQHDSILREWHIDP